MRYFFLLLFGLVFMTSFAQEEIQKTSIDSTFFTKVDSLYREDQFYIGMTYNLLTNAPKSFRQNGFSAGFSGGFLRDMPINKDRTLAVAIGAGLSYANYQENLVINDQNSGNEYTLVSNSELKKGKIDQFFIDVPIEFRWRNSTPTSYKFWRVYTGFKLQYLIFDQSKHVSNTYNYSVKNNADFNKLQYGPYIAVGFNTWNFQAYYGLKSLFKDVAVNNESVDMKTFNFGLMFYIL